MLKSLKNCGKNFCSLKWVPNFLTLCNSLCGFAAILITLRVYELGKEPEQAATVYMVSAFIILFAMIFDALDGFVARLLNASSVYGVEMDSLSDMVTFGLAPATIVAIMTHTMRMATDLPHGVFQEIVVYCLCCVYIGGAALRLARYNIHALMPEKADNSMSKNYFSGLPSPGAAAAICSIVIFAKDAATLPVEYNRYIIKYLPLYAAVLGLLMVSKVPYVHAGRWLFSVFKSKRRMVILFLIIAIIAVFRIPGITALVTLYVLSGFVNLVVKFFNKNCFCDGGAK